MTNEANWATDGLAVTDPKAYFRFFIRAMAQQCFYKLGQLDPDLQPQMDMQRFLSAFSISDNQQRYVVEDGWPLGPGSTAYSEELATTREQALELWEEQKRTQARFIASHARHGPLEESNSPGSSRQRTLGRPCKYCVFFIILILNDYKYRFSVSGQV